MKKTQKQVTVLAVYKFRKVARCCFSVLSSNGSDKYHTCFQGNGRESCDCPSKGGCYHRDQLRPQAQAYFESQKQQGNSPAATPETRVVQAYGNAGMGFYAEQCVDGQWARFPDEETGKDVCHPRKGSAETFLSTYSLVDAAANMRVFYSEW